MEQNKTAALTDFPASKQYTLTDVACRKVRGGEFLSKDGSLELRPGEDFCFVAGGARYWFQVEDPSVGRLMEDCLRRNPALARVTNAARAGGVFFLHIVFFAGKQYFGNVELVLSGKVKEALRQKGLFVPGQDMSGLEQSFALSDGIYSYFAYQTGSWKAHGEETETEGGYDGDYLQLYGCGCTLFARLTGGEFEQRLTAERVVFSKKNLPCMRLGTGKLSFTDHAALASEAVRRKLEESPGYLRLWDEYAALEGRFLLDKARSVGVIEYVDGRSNFDQNGNPVLYIGAGSRDRMKWIGPGDCIVFSDEVPSYLEDEEETWEQYNQLKNETAGVLRRRNQTVKVIGKQAGELILEEPAPAGKVASLSIFGDELQIVRRESARTRLKEGRSAMPGLGLLIEGFPNLDEPPRAKWIEPLSSRVREKCFAHPPTPAQVDAVGIALNTPDIAVIQGPPGTGKTTVIIAILERLNELSDKRRGLRGEVLVTSMQHDAVKNVIERLSLNGLPTAKLGNKHGDDDFDEVIQGWCDGLSQRLREKYANLKGTGLRELTKLMNLYAASPDDGRAAALLRCAKKLNTSAGLDGRIDGLLQELSLRQRGGDTPLLRAIRRLRCTRKSFADDGVKSALELYMLLTEQLGTGAGKYDRLLETLRQAAWVGDGAELTDELLQQLAGIRQELLDCMVVPPYYKKETVRSDVVEIYQAVKSQERPPENPEEEIAASFLREVEYNAGEIEDAVKSYSFVFGATMQQSLNKDVRVAKGLESRDEAPEYDTVIIDEAARAAPGDLMIPMAQARRRIILVGDHRQLPHIYDEDIFQELKESGNVVNEGDIKSSMFQHLWLKLHELERADQIRRTVTLDVQFRMHPELGKFVSDNFYKQYGEAFGSGLGEEYFQQDICPGPVKWVDFKSEYGPDQREPSGSRCRPCEASYIAGKVREYMEDSRYKELKFGVISFYSAQVERIKGELKDLLGKRLQVGSVDAFQGKEFDVIFLSVVRSGGDFQRVDLPYLERTGLAKGSAGYAEWEAYKEQTGKGLYGFLTSPNRLCVALSRQMRLLIVVGDIGMFTGEIAGRVAQVCVPAMKNLGELCIEKGAVENG